MVVGPVALTRQYCERIVLLEGALPFESVEAVCCLLALSRRILFASWEYESTNSCVEAGFAFFRPGLTFSGKFLIAAVFCWTSSSSSYSVNLCLGSPLMRLSLFKIRDREELDEKIKIVFSGSAESLLSGSCALRPTVVSGRR